jgi:hypothetical protein
MSCTVDATSLHKERKVLYTAAGENSSSTLIPRAQLALWPKDSAVSFLRSETADIYRLMHIFRLCYVGLIGGPSACATGETVLYCSSPQHLSLVAWIRWRLRIHVSLTSVAY